MRKVRASGRARAGALPVVVAVLAFTLLASAGCSKKSRQVPLPPAVTSSADSETPTPREVDPTAPAPELEIFLEPSLVRPGESAMLRWESRNADRVVITPDVGPVIASGRLRLFPESGATYQVTAEGPGGSVSKTATLELVSGGAPRTDVDETESGSLTQRFQKAVKPVFFGFDSADLTEEARITLDGNVRWLTRRDNLGIRLLVEGHCDVRGTEQYNLALGDKRGRVVRAYLVSHGVDSSRVVTVSLGEERPFSPGDAEADHALNRRAHFVPLTDAP